MTRILVVDDDPSVCDVVERLLVSSGYAVTTATTGRAALEAATRQSFVAAFVDLCMPTHAWPGDHRRPAVARAATPS